jgi:hypothetical protein
VNFVVAFWMTRTTCVSGFWLLIGDTSEGAVAFNVDPSGAAPESPPTAVLGEVGVGLL